VRQSHGLYITAPFVRDQGVDAVIETLRNARMDTAVLDMKDAAGHVNYDTQIAELEAHETGWQGDVGALVARLHAEHLRAVARIVCFNDRLTATEHPDRAIMDAREHHQGEVWTSWGTGTQWLDPWDTRNHDMIVELAREAAALGFDEVQLDYIRFPVDDGTPFASYPHERSDVDRRHLLLGVLERVDGLRARRRRVRRGLHRRSAARRALRWRRRLSLLAPRLGVLDGAARDGPAPPRALAARVPDPQRVARVFRS
jgi:hypothetical protein